MNGRVKSETQALNALPVPVTKVTTQQLAQLGEGRIAYLKPMKSEDIFKAFPDVTNIAPGLSLFALFGADGAPLVLADTRAAALANAWEQELQTVSLH